MKIVGISDVSIGYGSPEVPALMDSVCRLFGTKGVLLEPDEITRPPIPRDERWAFDVQRINSAAEDYSRSWGVEYMMSSVKTIDELKPDLLIIFGAAVFSVLLLLKKKPPKILYHATEFICSGNKRHVAAHKVMLDQVDLMTAPEVNRLIIDLEEIGVQPRHIAPILNCADVSRPDTVLKKPAAERNGHFLFYGTLHRRNAFAHYFWHPDIIPYPLDIYGRITDHDNDAVMEGLQSNPNCRYFGVLSAAQLNQQRQDCSWSLVWWNPEMNQGAYFLSPNRFFSSIQAGLPPICGPHPQCVTFVKRFDCGLIMDDWSVGSLARVMKEATAIAGTPRYAELVANCARAAQSLNWEGQFMRIVPALQKHVALL